MKTLVLNAATNKDGNTQFLLKIMKDIFDENEIETYEISSHYDEIFPCVDCKRLKKGCYIEGKCIYQDKLSLLLDLDTGFLNEFNNIILASPIRQSALTGQMMILSERLQVLYVRRAMLKLNDVITPKLGVRIFVGGGCGEPDIALRKSCDIFFELNASRKKENKVVSLQTDIVPAWKDEIAIEYAKFLALKMVERTFKKAGKEIAPSQIDKVRAWEDENYANTLASEMIKRALIKKN